MEKREKERVTEVARTADFAHGIMTPAIEYCGQVFRRYMKPEGSVLELGPAEGIMTDELYPSFPDYTVVDGADFFVEDLKRRYPKIEGHACLFEDFHPTRQYDTILLGHVLEHVENPVDILKLCNVCSISPIFQLAWQTDNIDTNFCLPSRIGSGGILDGKIVCCRGSFFRFCKIDDKKIASWRRQDVRHQHRERNRAQRGHVELGHDKATTARAFFPAEETLDFDAVGIVLVFGLCDRGFLGLAGTAESRARDADAVLLAIGAVLPRAIDLVDKDALRVVPGAFLVALDGILEDGALVVRVELDLFQTGVPLLVDAHIVLGAELDRRFCFAAHDGADVRLADADDAIRHTVRLVVEHILLLLIELADGLKKRFLAVCQRAAGSEVALDVAEVSAHITQLLPNHAADLLGRPLLGLGERQVLLAGDPLVCPRLDEGTGFLLHPVDDLFQLFACGVQELEVLRVLDV